MLNLVLLTEALFELSYAATGIKDLLLARVERMACCTNVSVDAAVLLGAAGNE